MKKWIIITKDDENDVEDWQVAGHAGLIIDLNTPARAVHSEAELKSAVESNAAIVVIINRKERRFHKLEFILNPQLIEAIWIHFGNVNFYDLNTKEKVADYWEETCKKLNFKIETGKELEVFPISSQDLPWSKEIDNFRRNLNTPNLEDLEDARGKAREYYGKFAPTEREVNVFLPFYLEVLCRLKEADVTANKELDIEELRHSWEAARKQWEEISPVAKAFLAIGPDFKDEDLKAFCKAYRECSADCTKQLGPAEMK